MTTNKPINTNFQFFFNWAFVIICIYLYLFGIAKQSFAQAISLSVFPPIMEITIQPGKEYKTQFTISNQGGTTTLTPKVVYFLPEGDFGNINTTKIPGPAWIKYSPEPFPLKSGESKNFSVIISPPTETEEIDYYLNLLFETSTPVDLLSNNSALHTAGIASNILISVSRDGNPKKAAEIVEFSAPKIIDSLFGKLTYIVSLKNTGNSFWKPIGSIKINDKYPLDLAPQNVLSGYKRQILCLIDENPAPCLLDKKPIFGKYEAIMQFSLDNSDTIYEAKITTFAFPFSIAVILAILRALYLLTKASKNNHSIHNHKNRKI